MENALLVGSAVPKSLHRRGDPLAVRTPALMRETGDSAHVASLLKPLLRL